MAHNEFVRNGYAYVGVSAQAVGVNALKANDAARYGSLVHPGDSFSYDIFTYVGERIRRRREPRARWAGSRAPHCRRRVAVGQPPRHVHQRDPAVVGDLRRFPCPQSRLGRNVAPAGAAPASERPVSDRDPRRSRRARDGRAGRRGRDRQHRCPAARQRAKYRLWELAGTSHADAYTLLVGGTDLGDGTGATAMFGYMRNPPSPGCTLPMNAGGHHWNLQAAYHWLDNWVRTGDAPPSAPPARRRVDGSHRARRDALGNALGGVRSPQVDAPIATLTGVNSGPLFCRLFGSTTPFTTEQLTTLYPTHADFVSAWDTALTAAMQRVHPSHRR